MTQRTDLAKALLDAAGALQRIAAVLADHPSAGPLEVVADGPARDFAMRPDCEHKTWRQVAEGSELYRCDGCKVEATTEQALKISAGEEV